jgi:hypothetical protein
MKKVAILQPTFNPWLGYFDLIDQSDVLVLYDDVQLSRQSWQVRNKIKIGGGGFLLSIPYVVPGDWKDLLICQAYTNELLPWRKKHIKTIEHSYRKSPYYDEVIEFVRTAYSPEFNTISSFNMYIILEILKRIGISVDVKISSRLIETTGTKDERLVKICRQLGVTDYLSPRGASCYIERNNPAGAFADVNLAVHYHNYEHPIYPQMHGSFEPYMGIFDLLFNVGFEGSLTVIRSGRRELLSSSQVNVNYAN